MRKLYSLFLVLISLFLVASCSKKPTPEEMLAAAKEIDRKSVEAASNRDATGFMSTRWNSPDYTVLDEDEFLKGFDKFNKALSDWMAKLKESKFAYTDIQNIVAGDMVIGQQKWQEEHVGLDGIRKRNHGLHSDVKAFRDGKWVVVSETFVKLPEERVHAPKPNEERIEDAYNKGDLEGAMAHFWKSPEIITIDEGKMVQGYDAVKALLKKHIADKKSGDTFELTENHQIDLGDTIVNYGRWQFVTPAETIEGLFSRVRALKDGKWVIVADHYSDGKKLPMKDRNLPRKK